MLFNSYIFIFLFLPVTFFIYFYLNKKRLTEASKAFLVLASLFFYSWWNISYLPLILLSMLVNYSIGKELSKSIDRRYYNRKHLLAIGVVFNLSLLGYFKYADFFITNIDKILKADIELLNLALPLAISFFTFQQIAYLVDSYRKETKEYDFLNYALFVTFFPQLIAGPIVHHAEMMPQFAKVKNKVKNYYHIALGIFIFSMGLFKKAVIADTFAIWASRGFDLSSELNMLEAWATSLSYTFQLYFDFSGYTDMAIGAALLFNIKLPINFYSPYKATSIQDFWRRWHITLSRFLKEYLYIPLGGNRKGEFRTYTNLFATFLLGGIWHGAGWTFVVWGALHGVAIVIHRVWQKLGVKMPAILGWFITFNFINIAWVFFRAKDFDSAIKVLHGMFKGALILPNYLSEHLEFLKESSLTFGNWSKLFQQDTYLGLWLIGGFIIVLFLKNSMQMRREFKPTLLYLSLTLLFSLSIFILYRKSEFIYFNF
ncbi:MAG: MBOAT family protein [Campylobacterota bacterium]|nr:MBOAT family protein [Campylobacterota bacterium]